MMGQTVIRLKHKKTHINKQIHLQTPQGVLKQKLFRVTMCVTLSAYESSEGVNILLACSSTCFIFIVPRPSLSRADGLLSSGVKILISKKWMDSDTSNNKTPTEINRRVRQFSLQRETLQLLDDEGFSCFPSYAAS